MWSVSLDMSGIITVPQKVFHGQVVKSVAHEPILTQITSGSFKWQNVKGASVYLQQFSIGASGGNPIIRIKVNGEYWTATQGGTGSGLVMNETDSTLYQIFTFQAANEDQEIEIPENASIEVTDVSGAGTISIYALIAWGFT